MSDIGEDIIGRLSRTSKLKLDSDMGRIIDYTIGEWLQRENDEPFFEQFFLQEATGSYLDLHGKEYGVFRKINESDDDYRKRIIYSSSSYLTINYLKIVYDVEIYSYVASFNVSNNTLVSDNPYYTGKFMGFATENIKNVLNKKFVFGGEIIWV